MCRVTRQIGKFHDDACETRSSEARLCSPFGQFGEQHVNNVRRLSAITSLVLANARERQFVLEANTAAKRSSLLRK
jgi:hypothetical protein